VQNLFGTDGVRGVANRELTPEMAFRIGRICAYLMKQKGEHSFSLVGKDTRRSGDMLEGALIAGICSSGMDVRCLGVLSTPAVAFLTRELKAAAGVIISASHNPIEDNGLKIFSSTGFKISDQTEKEIEQILAREDELPRPEGGEIGRVTENGETLEIYLESLRKIAPDLSGMHVAMDCGHGAVYSIAPELFRSLGAQVTVLNNEPNGVNINVDCGSTDPSQLQQVVKESGASLGLAFDGDADRLIAVDEKGEIVDGDVLMLLFSLYMKKNQQLKENTLVATIMSNGGLDIAAEQNGFRVVRAPVGDRFVLEKMVEGGYNLGGEQSGHIIFSDYCTTGDGVLTALQLSRILKEEGKNLSDYSSSFNRLPQVVSSCKVSRKEGWEEITSFQKALQKTYDQIGPYGRVLIRPSGTEPKMRIMVEGEKDEEELKSLAAELSEILSKELN